MSEYTRKYITTYWKDDNTRRAVLSRDKYHYIVDLFINEKLEHTELFSLNLEVSAADFADDWVRK